MNTNNSNLRSLAQKRKLAIGTGVSMEPLRNDPSYREVLMREYNIVTPTYIMKFEALQPQRHHYNFEQNVSRDQQKTLPFLILLAILD